MANIKFSIGLFVCYLVLASLDQIESADSEKCTQTCDQTFLQDSKNKSKSIESNASIHDTSEVHKPLDSIMMEYNSNYESSKYKSTAHSNRRKDGLGVAQINSPLGVAHYYARQRRIHYRLKRLHLQRNAINSCYCWVHSIVVRTMIAFSRDTQLHYSMYADHCYAAIGMQTTYLGTDVALNLIARQ